MLAAGAFAYRSAAAYRTHRRDAFIVTESGMEVKGKYGNVWKRINGKE